MKHYNLYMEEEAIRLKICRVTSAGSRHSLDGSEVSAPLVQAPDFTTDKRSVPPIEISGSHSSKVGNGRQDKMAGRGHRVVFI